jgi:hypothetical protein
MADGASCLHFVLSGPPPLSFCVRHQMSHANSIFRRWFFLPAVLVVLHTALVLAAFGAGGFAHDRYGHAGISGHVWVLFAIIDYPGSWLVWRESQIEPQIFFLILGMIHWGLIGLLIQAGLRWFRKRINARK